MKIYLIGGLGADQRCFQNLKLPFEMIFLDWIPFEKKMNLQSYATKFSDRINKTEEHTIIGVSFGGILAQEIALITQPKYVFIISSIKHPDHIPIRFLLFPAIFFNKLLPDKFKTWLNKYIVSIFFQPLGTFDQKVVHSIIADTDNHFAEKAFLEMIKHSWRKPYKPVIHIHGSKDRLFFHNIKKADYIIENGGHFMIFNKASETSKIILSCIK